jgi:hypothetical protein
MNNAALTAGRIINPSIVVISQVSVMHPDETSLPDAKKPRRKSSGWTMAHILGPADGVNHMNDVVQRLPIDL